ATIRSNVVSDKTVITGNLAAPRCTLLLLLSAPLPAPSLSLKILQDPSASVAHHRHSRCRQRPVVVVAVALGKPANMWGGMTRSAQHIDSVASLACGRAQHVPPHHATSSSFHHIGSRRIRFPDHQPHKTFINSRLLTSNHHHLGASASRPSPELPSLSGFIAETKSVVSVCHLLSSVS
ncbi:hypothetical protein WG66_003711, partial [Moniliophthora roreri]